MGYKSSEAFEEEMAEAEAASYDVGFSDRVKQVKKLYPELDVSSVERHEDDDGDGAGAMEIDDLAQELTQAIDDPPLTMEEPTHMADNPPLMTDIISRDQVEHGIIER